MTFRGAKVNLPCLLCSSPDKTMRNTRRYLERQERKLRTKIFSLQQKRSGSQDVSVRLTRAKLSLRRVRKELSAFKDYGSRAKCPSWRSLWKELEELEFKVQGNGRRLQKLSQALRENDRAIRENDRTLRENDRALREQDQALQDLSEQVTPLFDDMIVNDIRVLLGECVTRFYEYVAGGLNFKWSKMKTVLRSERVLNPNNHWMAPRHRTLKAYLKNINFTTEDWDTSISFMKSRTFKYHKVGRLDAYIVKEYQRKVYDVLSQYPPKANCMLRKVFGFQQQMTVEM